jgi:2-polyprenyl-3-methyl-5-hydroxy-6-metoxy-1,4-benzoquinol methylase
MHKVTKCLWCKSSDLSVFTHRKDGIGILKCAKCGLYMVATIPENLDEYYYKEEYFNAGEINGDTGYTESYDLMAPAFLLWQNSLIETANEGQDRKNFLEIGCATGNLLEIMRESQNDLETEGIDISEFAVNAAVEKGLAAKVAYIETLNSDPKKDIIFSAETLEHLDDLRSFLTGVTNNWSGNGLFLFYVPSISVADAEKDPEHYLRFNTNMEHILHFTPQFFERELPQFFDAKVLIKEFKTGFGPCIVGAVAKNDSSLSGLTKLLDTLSGATIPSIASPNFLKNLAIISLKFGQFDLADKAIARLEGTKGVDRATELLVAGLRGYHTGELISSNTAFEEYLKIMPSSQIALRSLLFNSRELNRLYLKEIEKLTRHASVLEDAQKELMKLRKSLLVRTAFKINRGLKKGAKVGDSFRKQK